MFKTQRWAARMIKDEHKQFLLGPASAGKTRHSGRMLYDHLAGTHALLEAWGNSEDICNAGLFHSIYGTRRFRHQSWPLTDRETIREADRRSAPRCWPTLFCTRRSRGVSVADDDCSARLARDRGRQPDRAGQPLRSGSSSLRDSDISDGAKHAIDRQYSQREVAA